MDDNNTHPQKIDSTLPVYLPEYNPYYHDQTDIGLAPPPPNYHKPHKHLLLPIMLVSASIMFLAGSSLLYLANKYTVDHSVPTPIVRFIEVSPGITSTPIINKDYTASDILADFMRSGASVGDVNYGTSLSIYSQNIYPSVSVNSTSSATWLDPPQEYGSASIGLWVYETSGYASTAYNEVAHDANTNSTTPNYLIPTEFLSGRCLMLVSGFTSQAAPWSGYQQALQQYCV